MSDDLDPFEIRMVAAQQGLDMLDAFDGDMMALLLPLHEAISNMVDHLAEHGLSQRKIAGILTGFALSAAYPEPQS
jgi:microsomal dipeptidase-like Zn-dependent dipeptidase